ncbi:DNA helicase IV [Allocatelliglobosispora scoriae]|uniref:DNA helicase IV n=1 Tax=Allocatelliglobosispora scoriae TaxID=643052 RepID=A0A841BST3_9ACTN|nr:AAA family ATPase [Allocatelliglobosispora scoriae]MBB5870765.1 DNA helicase IV [Allocatelliglobosispora scoriae]
MSDLDHDLAAEQTHLTVSREALRAMRERAEGLFATGNQVAGDAYAAETLGRTLAMRVKELADDPTTPLFFGKLSFDGTEHAGHTFHIGRRHVTDAVGEPLVLDWRAPVSRSFYRASARDPQGVGVRRRFGFATGELTSFEDEHLNRGEELGTRSTILTNEIERPRVGPMRDIVATIQPEQDELVRAELDESICVQGAPGTGKTAVGLHRAAYLLYLHRERLRRSGVLIIGPNSAFLRYIAAVLPALGEVEVKQHTVEDLIGHVAVRATDSPAAAALKHDARVAEQLRSLLWRRVRRPSAPITVSDGSYRWRIDLGPLTRIVDDVRREEPAYSLGRERVRSRVVDLLLRQSEARGESPGEAWQRKMGKIGPVAAYLDEVWPVVTPEGLVAELLTDPPEGFEAIAWATPPRSVKTAKWSTADALLIDEAAGLLESVPSAGHIVIDEAQDLSPMQARAIARRSSHGSVTLLGDLAQGTAPWSATDWRDTLHHLGKPDARVVPLTIGFRVPEQVLELANRLLPSLAVDVPPARSLRPDGRLIFGKVGDLAATAADALTEPGSVGVICADASIPSVIATLTAAGLSPGGPEDDERLTVIGATLAKGLEYDHVIVIEPADIVAAEERGLHRLYVVLTRAVTALTVLHDTPLPAPLA